MKDKATTQLDARKVQMIERIEKAVDAAVDEWHRDIHAQLEHDMDTIRFLGKVRTQTKVT